MSPARPEPKAEPTLTLAAALERSEPLGLLLRRLQEARSHYEAVAPLLPPGLRADVRPGPVDGQTWTLLAAHNPAAAKLRQLLPLLLQRLRETGWEGNAIKVRVQPPPAR
ncbi:MAG TPA: DciA family protein [Rubrivivax sp.]|nr:DciA family protein [Rubrivivax sp.]